MTDKNINRRGEILQAARQEFIKEGISGARTQAMADHIGVTKAMIHYYFKTKENLFKEVFRESSARLMEGIMEILNEDKPLFTKIESFIDQLINRLEQNPKLAGFIIGELNSHPEITIPIFQSSYEYQGSVFAQQLREAASNYETITVTPHQLITNILSLCMIPYTGQGFLQSLLELNDDHEYTHFLEQRREIIKDTIITWLAG
jgi:AcrR family transcriptional regulator